ncbi:NACHT domain-containing protein, partial [Serratia sp. 14-2641]|uniref:NACHT domain-containing protein n=1 Tax=Serratia sp. 14-2641 TaxID=1841657 RepID=UPI00111258E2
MIDLSTLIAGPFFTTFFETIGEKIAASGIKLVQGKANKILDSFSNSKIANLYLERTVYKIFVFRTITKGDRDVYLDEIYHPLKLKKMNHKSKGTNRIVIIGDNSKLDSSECNVIVGLAGQGKTTVMRKLFLEEIVRAERLPFFINLRQCDFTENGCAEILLEHLNTNGIECKILDVINLLKTKKVIFYWDGFDEISASQRNNALDVIMSVHDMYGCSSIVTTRPDTEITRQPRTQRYDVEFLDEEDVSSMIVKIIDNQDVSDSILAVLKEKESVSYTHL